MREILFRAKRNEIGDFVEGSLIAYPDGDCYIARPSNDPCVLDKFCVDPTTVGQYTGLMGKNGKRVFEGDVFEWGYAGVKEFRYVVAYDATLASFVGERHFGFVSLNGVDIEIIGNIHDNPELIGGDHENH